MINPKEQFTLADLVSIERDNRVLVRMDMFIDHSSKLFVTKHGVIPPGASVEAFIKLANEMAQTLYSGPLTEPSVVLIQKMCKLAHTPKTVAAYKKAQHDKRVKEIERLAHLRKLPMNREQIEGLLAEHSRIEAKIREGG